MSKWKERIPGIVISVLLVAVFAVFMVILLQSKMVPTKLLILGGIALVLLVASAVLLVRSIRNKGQFICGASLSLVLALTMMMSLVTINAGAKEFTDDEELNYKEAVDVMSAVNVISGYAEGDFRPTATLTRGAAAKIICNLILGPTTASALAASTAPFKDVPVTNTFAGYITYCSQQGIISGYADGTFRPTGTLSGNAFMKMMLAKVCSLEAPTDRASSSFSRSTWVNPLRVFRQIMGVA